MGEVRASVALSNFADVEAEARGFLPATEVRSLHKELLVDTGAVMLFLPQDNVERLGLRLAGKVIVTYADDRREERPLARDVQMQWGDRMMVTDCIVDPPLSEALLGQIVLD